MIQQPNKSQDLSLREKIILNYQTGMVKRRDDNEILSRLITQSKTLND